MTVSCVLCYIYHAISGRGFPYNFVECVCKNVALQFSFIYAEEGGNKDGNFQIQQQGEPAGHDVPVRLQRRAAAVHGGLQVGAGGPRPLSDPLHLQRLRQIAVLPRYLSCRNRH